MLRLQRQYNDSFNVRFDEPNLHAFERYVNIDSSINKSEESSLINIQNRY